MPNANTHPWRKWSPNRFKRESAEDRDWREFKTQSERQRRAKGVLLPKHHYSGISRRRLGDQPDMRVW